MNRPVTSGRSVSTSDRSESELASLKRTASELAAQRKERPTTVHLLAAVAARPGPAATLLVDRGLDKEGLLKAGRTFDEEMPDALSIALAQAREVAKRARGPVSTDGAARRQPTISPDSRIVMMEPTSLHLLVALLAERRFAAFRALALSGIDAVRLRGAALTLALGIVPARREIHRATEAPRSPASTPPSFAPPKTSGPTVVPLLPPAPVSGRRGMPAAPAPRNVRPEALPTRSSEPPSAERVSRPRPVRRRPDAAPPRSPSATVPPPSAKPTSNPPPAQDASEGLDASRSPLLAAIGTERRDASGPKVVGRQTEVERVLDVLAKFRANAPCLVGPAGVGKTSVALALAAQLAQENTTLIEVAAAALIAGTGARGALADRVATLFDEARRSDERIVLFIDDLHELLAAGDEAVAELKVQLARGDVRFVTATNTESLRRAVENDPHLHRRLVPIEIEEPDEEDAFLMVKAAAESLEPHHGVRYDDDALAAAVGWSVRYLPSRALPDKAIGALDYAGARVKRAAAKQPKRKPGSPAPSVTLADVADAVSELAAVPCERLLETDRERMLALESFLAERVVGHTEPLSKIAAQLRKSAAGLRDRRPLGSFLLLGPTGVGKTETAKALAEALFGAGDAMTRIDLSEYAEAHAVARLIGAPPGYVGHDAGGQLTEAVRKRPYQVILLDEVEKAHQDVLLSFLQVLDEGHMTDGRGRRVDFTNVVIVCTSNLGSRDVAGALRGKAVGFARSGGPSVESLSDLAVQCAKKGLPLELFNRFDEILFFAPLSRAEVGGVARHILAGLEDSLERRGIRLEVDDAVIELLLDAGGYDPELGARPMKRTVARLVEGPLAEMILRGELPSGSVALLGVEDGAVVVVAMPARATA
ncbi:MAG: AAA domain-containing protein [Polyangiaceae bacterium]|nr:AAA domain-containing protein [Polyangiaceae bacterium]